MGEGGVRGGMGPCAVMGTCEGTRRWSNRWKDMEYIG